LAREKMVGKIYQKIQKKKQKNKKWKKKPILPSPLQVLKENTNTDNKNPWPPLPFKNRKKNKK